MYMNSLHKKINRKGFTMVEILAILVIIGIISIIVVPSLVSVMEKSKKMPLKNLLMDLSER